VINWYTVINLQASKFLLLANSQIQASNSQLRWTSTVDISKIISYIILWTSSTWTFNNFKHGMSPTGLCNFKGDNLMLMSFEVINICDLFRVHVWACGNEQRWSIPHSRQPWVGVVFVCAYKCTRTPPIHHLHSTCHLDHLALNFLLWLPYQFGYRSPPKRRRYLLGRRGSLFMLVPCEISLSLSLSLYIYFCVLRTSQDLNYQDHHIWEKQGTHHQSNTAPSWH